MQKKFFSVVVIAAVLVACNDAKTDVSKTDDVQKKNMEASQKIADAFQTGNVAAIDSFVADDFVDHTDRGDKIGRDSLKAMVELIRANFKDMKSETISTTADKDYVFQLMKYTGTSDGSMGMPAGPYTTQMMEISRFREGKAIEHWAYMDMQEMMKMMAPPQPTRDTAMKKSK